MDDLLLLILVVAVAYWLGYRMGHQVATWRIIAGIVKNPQEIQRAIAQLQEVQAEVAQASADSQDWQIEQQGTQWYVYDSQGQFLAQGASEAEARDRAGKIT
jgi:hypothetical protein